MFACDYISCAYFLVSNISLPRCKGLFEGSDGACLLLFLSPNMSTRKAYTMKGIHLSALCGSRYSSMGPLVQYKKAV